MNEKITWGTWIKRRARHVGFLRQADLATAIRCSDDQMCRWVALKSPPTTMRKGFDVALIKALRSDRYTVFLGWRDVAPEMALDINPASSDELSLRRKVIAIVELLGPDQLSELHDKGRKLLAGAA